MVQGASYILIQVRIGNLPFDRDPCNFPPFALNVSSNRVLCDVSEEAWGKIVAKDSAPLD